MAYFALKSQKTPKKHDFLGKKCSYTTVCTSPHGGSPYMLYPHSPHTHGIVVALSPPVHTKSRWRLPPPLSSRPHMAPFQRGGGANEAWTRLGRRPPTGLGHHPLPSKGSKYTFFGQKKHGQGAGPWQGGPKDPRMATKGPHFGHTSGFGHFKHF